jgi:hypothetical protein
MIETPNIFTAEKPDGRLDVASAAGGTLDSLHANPPKRNSPAARDRIGGARARRWPAA